MTFWKRLFGIEQAELINDYFVNAVRVFMWGGQYDARSAALAAAKVAAPATREAMLKMLSGMQAEMASQEFDDEELNSAISLVRARITELIVEIGVKDWSIKDIFEEKAKLTELNPEYARALDNPDPAIFERLHPDLFRV